MNTDQLQKIYEIIIKEGRIPLNDFSPNIIINQGKYEFYGIDAEFLLTYSAEAIQLPIDFLDRLFPFDTYFFPETPFTGLILIIDWFKQLFNYFINDFFQFEEKQSITALQYANILFDIWQKYQKEQTKNK